VAKIKSVYAKKDEIPAGKEDLFTEQDGQWVLDAEVEEHPAVAGLRSAYAKESQRRKDQGARLKLFEALGHEPDDLEKVIEMAENAAGGKKGATDLATWKEATVKAHKAQVDKLTLGIQKRDEVLGTILGENELRKELGPKALSMTALLAIAKPLVKVEFDEATGQATVAVIDDKGKARVANGQGQPFTIKDLVAELETKDDLKALFKGTDARGSGASGEKGQAAASKTIAQGDTKAFLANLDGISKGEVAVQ
jgi:hypothetical protein